MEQVNKKSIDILKEKYYILVKNGINYQKKRDIESFTMNALKKESLALKIQAFSRKQL